MAFTSEQGTQALAPHERDQETERTTRPHREHGAPYVIAMPVPNITGSLHIGHALNLILQDVAARHIRATGQTVAFAPGVDHAGLTGQLAAERQLIAEGKSRQELGRDRFLEYMLRWHDDHLHRLLDQMRRLGLSADWEDAVSSIDHRRRQLVQDAFVALYDRGLLYRESCLVNWCVGCGTCIPDDEIKRRELTRTAYHIGVTADDGKHHTLATLHLPLLLAAGAVRVPVGHPACGASTVRIPVIERELAVHIGERRDRALGMHLSLVAPAYNADDFEEAQRHGLVVENIYSETGNIVAPQTRYHGLSDQQCRERLLHDLEQAGALAGAEPYLHGEALHSLCGSPVLPRATSQWFLDLDDLRDTAADLLTHNVTAFNHPHWEERYRATLEMVLNGDQERAPWWEGACLAFVRGFSSSRDWMVSRQNWWGIPVPAWLCRGCEAVHVERTDTAPRCDACERPMTASQDVLDVLFHSALWAYCITSDHSRAYHADLAVIGHDILEFWIPTANLLAGPLCGDSSIRNVVVHGVICDENGKKMSKSLGNTVDLDDLLARYETETVRSLVLSLLDGADGQESIPMREADIDQAAALVQGLATWIEHTVIADDASSELILDLAALSALVDNALREHDFASAYRSIVSLPIMLGEHAQASPAEIELVADILEPFHPTLADHARRRNRLTTARSRCVGQS